MAISNGESGSSVRTKLNASLALTDAITASATELNYVDGVTSAIQTQLNAKEPLKGSDDNYVTDAQLVVIGNTSGTNTGDNATNSQYSGLAASKQDTLVSATNIKTINSSSLLGSGNIAVQSTLVSGTNIKTVNGSSLLGSGDLTISGGSSTLLALSAGSTTSPNSIYNLTANIPVDFRGSDASSIIFIDETNKRVGIRNSSPSYALDVQSTTGTYPTASARIRGTGGGSGWVFGSYASGYAGIWSTNVGTPQTDNYCFLQGGGTTYVNSPGGGDIGFSISDTRVASVRNTGLSSTKFFVTALNTAPSSASDTGTLGEIRWGSDYVYLCTATNTWKRAALATW